MQTGQRQSEATAGLGALLMRNLHVAKSRRIEPRRVVGFVPDMFIQDSPGNESIIEPRLEV
jgi:hypothetical protein